MSIIIALIITLAAILVIALIAHGVKQRKEKRADARHSEAEQMRTAAKATNLQADRHAAEAEERAARSKRESLAAEQHQMAAAAQRSTAQGLRTRADEVDPDL